MKMKLRVALAEIRHRPGRSAILWLAIAVAATLLTAAFAARTILQREVPRSFATAAPPSIVVHLDAVDARIRRIAGDVPGVAAVDGRRLIRARAQVAPGIWRALRLYVVRDFDDIRVSRVAPVEGAWPPGVGQMLVEGSGLGVLRSAIGKDLRLRLPERPGEVSVRITGVVHDAARAPGWQDDIGYGYITPTTAAALGVGPTLDALQVVVAGDRAAARATAIQLRQRLRDAGAQVQRIEVRPRVHPHADHMAAMIALLAVLSALALVLASALAGNLISATVTRQTRQIGILRTLGAHRREVAAVYLTMVGVVATVAIVFAVPIGLLVGARFARFAARQLNLVALDTTVDGHVIAAVGAIGVLVPMLAAAVPVIRAVRMRTRDAVRDTGTVEPARSPARWLQPARILTRLSLRNTFRRPARVALTLISLAVGGAMLMTAVNVYQSLIRAVDTALDARGDDIEVRLPRPVPAGEVAAIVTAVDGVGDVQLWPAARVGLELFDTTAAHEQGLLQARYGLLAPPDGQPPGGAIWAGRWPATSSAGAPIEVVANRQLSGLEARLTLGGAMRLHVGGRTVDAVLVGWVQELAAPGLYTHPESAAALFGTAGTNMAGAIRLDAREQTEAIAGRLEDALVSSGLLPTHVMTRAGLREALVDHFAIMLVVLMAIALAALLVGGLGLGTTLGLNVLDRTRELGILRAMGGDDRHIRRLVLIEGAVISSLGALGALIVSLPLTLAVTRAIGPHILRIDLPFTLSPTAVFAWCMLAAVIMWIACQWPASMAIGQPTRQLLARD